MQIITIQPDIRWLDHRINLREIERMLVRALETGPSPDIVVLPEMFATGFCMDAAACSEGGGEVLEWMKSIADRYDSAVTGTAAIAEGERYFNRFWFVKPGGGVTAYDKRHLFTYGREHLAYTPGSSRVMVSWRGFVILLQTCYDLRFPVFSRNQGDYDIAIYCANWPGSRIGVWDTLLRARAMENVCYVVGANRVGDDPGNSYPGHSAVFDFKGNPLTGLADGECGCIGCALSREELLRFREKFPVLRDADRFTLDGNS